MLGNVRKSGRNLQGNHIKTRGKTGLYFIKDLIFFGAQFETSSPYVGPTFLARNLEQVHLMLDLLIWRAIGNWLAFFDLYFPQTNFCGLNISLQTDYSTTPNFIPQDLRGAKLHE